jgi:hypothetical protein
VYRVLRDVSTSREASFALAVFNESKSAGGGTARHAWELRRHLLYELYSRLDRRFMKSTPDPFERVSAEDVLGDCPRLAVQPRQTRYSDYFEDADLDRIRRFELDVALRFGFRILRGGALQIARHGVWSYHHDDGQAVRGGPPGFWEVMEGHAATGSMLQVLTEDLDAGSALYRSWSPTHRRSVHRNKAHVYWKSSAFVARKLAELHRNGAAAVDGGAAAEPDRDVTHYSGRLYRKPTNAEFLPRLVAFMARAAGGRLLESCRRGQWFIAFRREQNGITPVELFRFRPLWPARERYWADPFPLRHQGRDWIFFEDFRYRQKVGHIAAIEIDGNGPMGPAVVALERPYHLSHPFLFRHHGELFMVPESAQNRTVEAYRCVRFPDQWTLEANLLEQERAVDATLHFDGDRWWMFVNVAPEGARHAHDELCLYFASSPLGPWQPHARNPVKSDARSARPAGTLFAHAQRLYRPAQDCTVRYGHSIVVNEIERLSPTEFTERCAWRVEPRWRKGVVATHTLNSADGLSVVDGMRWLYPGWASTRS